MLLAGRDQYGGYLAKTALSVSVDQEMAAQCIARLIKDPNLRRSMAEKARTRARSPYNWKHIIPAYEKFWAEMAAQRRSDHTGKQPTAWASLPPQAPDPYTMYAAYPTAPFRESDKLTVALSADAIKQLWKHEINVFALDVMIPPDEAMALVKHVSAQGTPTIGEVLRAFPAVDRAQLWRTIGWLVKLGVFNLKG